MVDLNVNLNGVPNLQTLTIEIGSITGGEPGGGTEILTRLDALGVQMSNLNDAVSNFRNAVGSMMDGINQDVANLRSIVDQALSTQTADQAEIQRLQGEADQAVQNINDATQQVQSVDIDPSFPQQQPPVDTPPVDVPVDQPVDTGGDGGSDVPPQSRRR